MKNSGDMIDVSMKEFLVVHDLEIKVCDLSEIRK